MVSKNPPEVAKAPAQPAPGTVRLPRLREDLKLMRGPSHLDGSPSWRVQDPMRNSFFEIGWLEFELLSRWREHRTLDGTAARESDRRAFRIAVDELLSTPGENRTDTHHVLGGVDLHALQAVRTLGRHLRELSIKLVWRVGFASQPSAANRASP